MADDEEGWRRDRAEKCGRISAMRLDFRQSFNSISEANLLVILLFLCKAVLSFLFYFFLFLTIGIPKAGWNARYTVLERKKKMSIKRELHELPYTEIKKS